MSASQLKEMTKNSKPQTIAGLLTDPKVKAQMAVALPKHMTADRLSRIALTEVRKTPKLAQCDQASFLGAIMQCAQLGLEPGSALGHAYLLPFENRRANKTEVQFIIGYRGMIDLARRSGQIISIESRAVFESDKFEVKFGLDPDLKHEPNWESGERGALRAVYAVARLKDGGIQFEVMSRAEIEKIKSQSKSANSTSSPWFTHFEEMAKKTVIRRLFKYLPVSIELATAVTLDEQAEAGIQQDNAFVIDSDAVDVTDKQAPVEPQTDTMTFEQIKTAMSKAVDADSLDDAASFIGELEDEQQRVELVGLYAELRAKFDDLFGE